MAGANVEQSFQKRRWQRRGDEEFTFTLSAFYAKIVILLGIALPLTDAICSKGFESYDGFYIFLYLGSVLFLIYMYFVHLRDKSIEESFRHSFQEQRDPKQSDDSLSIRTRSYNRYGSFYFRMGVTGFGIGTAIYSVLQFAQYLELYNKEGCYTVMRSLKPLSRIVFILLQMLFIFSYSNFLDVQRSKFIAKFGLMHMIAANVCDWFYVLINEAQLDIYTSRKLTMQTADNQTSLMKDNEFLTYRDFEITLGHYDKKFGCFKSDIMASVLLKTEPYLGPCAVEYNLLCSVILLLIWKNNCSNNEYTERYRKPSVDLSSQNGTNLLYNKNHSLFSVDCAQAHKGLFSGLLVLAVTIISLIMFFELVSHNDRREIAILQVNIWEAVMFVLGIIAAIFCINTMRNLELKRKQNGLELELEHVLLLVTQWGIFLYFLFQIIGGVLMGTDKGTGGFMRIITPLSALIQSCCQTVLILDAWKRQCTTKTHMKQKPGRQLITFLLVLNIALWMVNRSKNNSSVSHPNQMDFYGVLSWNIITHVSMPLVVSYRFQSTVCFYEIWKKVYKTRDLSRMQVEEVRIN